MKEKTTRETIAEIMGDDADAGPDVETAAPEPAEPAQEATPEIAGEAQQVEATPEAQPDKPRRPDGKFAPKAAAAPAAPVATPAVPVLEALKPPADWRAGPRSAWDKLPRDVQEEAIRLHVETKKTLQEAAGHRQAAETWQKTVAPYEHMFRASGKTAQEGVGWLVQQFATLSSAPMAQRVRVAAGMIRDYVGTDEAAINALAAELEGKAAPVAQVPQAIRPEQVQEMVRKQLADERAQAVAQTQEKAIADFEASQPEFYDRVLPQMKALLMVELQQGRPITPELLKAAHQQALRMNPETAATLKQRDDAAAAEKKNADEAKKRAAASGIRNEPAGPAGGGSKRPMTTREQLKAEFEAGSNRV